MTTAEELARRARRLVLQNSVQHGGVARPGPVLARLLATEPDLRSRSSEVADAIRAAIDVVTPLSPDERATELARLGGPEADRGPVAKDTGGEFPDLAGAERGRVVLRMAPFPSGALHIGNGRMVFINDYYRRRYAGKLLLVFDDTIGSEEKRLDPDTFEIILRDLDLCDAKPDTIYYKSDLIPHHYPWARRVIQAGGAYVCTCPTDLLRANRASGIACLERAQDAGTTLDGWEKMLGGGFAPGEAVLRLRTDLADPDPAFRDRVLFRISEIDHPRVGHKFRVWPLLEFSWAVDDIELGVTHVIRGKDLVMEDRMQRYIWDLLGIRGPPFLHWGLLRVREAKISKSKSYAEVHSGAYDGWGDPRTWSFRSLDRRGITPEATRRFTLSFGLSLADIEVPAETLYSENRAIIDPTTMRRAFVEDPIAVDIDALPPELGTTILRNHPDQPALGTRTVLAGSELWLAGRDVRAHLGEEIRLKDLANIRFSDVVPSDGPVVATFTSRENKRIPRLQWVARPGAVLVDLLGTEGEHRAGMAEAALGEAPAREVLQFERVGFVRVEADQKPGERPVRVCFGHP
jgi:glutamyl-tRNA synthetase